MLIAKLLSYVQIYYWPNYNRQVAIYNNNKWVNDHYVEIMLIVFVKGIVNYALWGTHKNIITHCEITLDVPSNVITHCDITMGISSKYITHCDVIMSDGT